MTKTTTELAQHVNDLARAFKVQLNIEPGMSFMQASAGVLLVACPACGVRNRIPRAGRAACGKCKHDLGPRDSVQCILIPPVTDALTYATALHELGHCIHPTGRVNDTHGGDTMRRYNRVGTLRDMRLQLLEEHSAWEWAQANALEWTHEMAMLCDDALESYHRYARSLGVFSNEDRGTLWCSLREKEKS